eukprot:403369189
MGKKRHAQDKMWITYAELTSEWGGKKEEHKSKKEEYVKMPFYYCNLSMGPFVDPYCTDDGIIFDLLTIIPYLRKYKKNPITGAPMKESDLIKLNFHKNEQGEYHCPITYKTFTDHTHIIAIRETGNVISFEAFNELNKEPQWYFDLLTNEKFDPKKIITIQDPKSPGRKVNQYHYKQNNEDIQQLLKEKSQKKKDEGNQFINQPIAGKRILDELKQSTQAKQDQSKNSTNTKFASGSEFFKSFEVEPELESLRVEPKVYIEKRVKEGSRLHNSSTEGLTSSGFTSTRYEPVTKNVMRQLSDNEIRKDYYNPIKSKQLKGKVSLVTNYGTMIIEIHCDRVPKTGENFLELCENKYFKGTKFHRLIKGFMIQGGDPDGTGRGGKSYFGEKFEDEFHPSIPHMGRGVLSMANSGENTNGSQFFITFKSCPHLDGKHSVFGKVIQGLEFLDKVENMAVNSSDMPKDDIKIEDTIVLVNPYRDTIAEILMKEWKKKHLEHLQKKDQDVKWTTLSGFKKTQDTNQGVDTIGKYIKNSTSSNVNPGDKIKSSVETKPVQDQHNK